MNVYLLAILGSVLISFTAPFNDMRTLKFKLRLPTNAFFATVDEMFDGSFQLLTTSEHYFAFRDFFSSSSNMVGKDRPALSAIVES